jgi:hypothetical protein
MRAAAAWLELPKSPHPTRLRRATFSHQWEKDARPRVRQTKKQGCVLPFTGERSLAKRSTLNLAAQAELWTFCVPELEKFW